MRWMPLFALFALACDPAKDTGDTAGTLDPGNGGGTDCKGTAPVIEELTLTEGDPITGEGGGDPQPTVLIVAEYSDEDGDAHVVAMDIWYDDVVDGTVDTSGAAGASLAPTAVEDDDGNPVDECDGKGGSFGVMLGVTGDDLEFETEYDFGVIIYDANNTASEPKFGTVVTPAALD